MADEIDFGLTAADYARHRLGFPDELFARLSATGAGTAGQVVADVGCGTGALGRGFARSGASVIGIDPSTALVDQAKALDAEAGVSIDYRIAAAEALELDTGSVDVVAAGQCWHWFDPKAAAAEFRRVVRPGGWVAICYLDWLPYEGNVAAATEALILEHNPSWAGADGTGFHPEVVEPLVGAGFIDVASFSFDLDLAYTHESWRGRIRASAGIGASLAPDAVAAFDAELAALLEASFPGPELPVHHRVWAMTARAAALD